MAAPLSYALMSNISDDVTLEAGQACPLLFKFMSHRDVEYGSHI
jgi:hypothetical protein